MKQLPQQQLQPQRPGAAAPVLHAAGLLGAQQASNPCWPCSLLAGVVTSACCCARSLQRLAPPRHLRPEPARCAAPAAPGLRGGWWGDGMRARSQQQPRRTAGAGRTPPNARGLSAPPPCPQLSTVQFHLLITTIMMLSREGLRRGCQRFKADGTQGRQVRAPRAPAPSAQHAATDAAADGAAAAATAPHTAGQPQPLRRGPLARPVGRGPGGPCRGGGGGVRVRVRPGAAQAHRGGPGLQPCGGAAWWVVLRRGACR